MTASDLTEPDEERRRYVTATLNRQLNNRRTHQHRRGIPCRATYAFRIPTGIITLECEYNPEKYATILEQFIAENPAVFSDRESVSAIGGIIAPLSKGHRKPTAIKSILATLRNVELPDRPNLN